MTIVRASVAVALACALTACKSSSENASGAAGHTQAAPSPSPTPVASAAPAPSPSASGEEGSPALGDVDLALKGPDEKPVRLAPYLGPKLTLVNLWATWCGPCRAEMPRLSRLHEQEAARGLKVVGISLDEDHALVQKFLKKTPVKYPVVFGGKATTEKLGELPALPATLVLDKAGKVDRVLFGALDDETEKGIIEELHKN